MLSTERKSVIAFLWTPSRRRLSLALEGDADAAARRLAYVLTSSEEVTGGVAGRGVKIRRLPNRAAVKGIFSTYFYGVVQEDGENCRLAGHFQWHPVGRIYAVAWIGLSALIPLAFLVAGALRGTAESTAREALPYLFPVLLPFLVTGMIYLQRRRDRPDELAIRRWLAALEDDWEEIETESATPAELEFTG